MKNEQVSPMKHLVAGRFGKDDAPHIDAHQEEQRTDFDFLSESGGFGHGIGHALEDLRRLGVYPTDVAVDLFLLSTLVYAADTRIFRR